MWGIIITIGTQIATSVINQRYNNKYTEKLKQMQRDFRDNNLKHALSRDWDRFRSLCNFQVNLETISHKERLDRIDQDFIDSLDRWAHSDVISSHYPLRISPYIINKSVIPISTAEIGKIRNNIFCILTGSNDKVFNQEVLPELDEKLCNVISTYWSQKSTHTMCYFSSVWNENIIYCNEHIENLKSVIHTPTVTITPYFEKHENRDGNSSYELVIIINMWGVGAEESVSYRVKSGYIINCSKLPIKYSQTEKSSMLNAIFQCAICSLAYNIDMYYWTHYYQAPIFPSLVSQGLIIIDEKEKPKLCDAYTQFYRSLALGLLSEDNNSKVLVKDVAKINLFNFPERSINFLNSVSELSKSGIDVDRLIIESLLSIYEARTCERVVNLQHIEVRNLDDEDMRIVSEMLKIAHNYDRKDIQGSLVGIIDRKIRTWQ